MSESLDLATFTGAHPTNGQLVDQLRAWGFRQLRVEGVHLVFRGPHGGTVRVLRSLLGRVAAEVSAKAARLTEVDEAMFWAGPEAFAATLADQPEAGGGQRGEVGHDSRAEVGAEVGATERDQLIAVVLAVHVAMDQPLGFSQVVALAETPVTRSQVSGASSQLCRDGQLVRIRAGVYQWADGIIVQRLPAKPAPPSATPLPAAARTQPVAARLFEQLFPNGVRMTGEILTDFERWAQLTEKLATHAS